MQSYLVQFIEQEVQRNNSDSINRILGFLHSEIIPKTANYFDELVEVAIVARPMYSLAWNYKPFIERLQTKIIEQRGIEDGQLLINKFMD